MPNSVAVRVCMLSGGKAHVLGRGEMRIGLAMDGEPSFPNPFVPLSCLRPLSAALGLGRA